MEFIHELWVRYGSGVVAIVLLGIASVVFATRLNTMQVDIASRVQSVDDDSKTRATNLRTLIATENHGLSNRIAALEGTARTDVVDLRRRVMAIERDVEKLEQQPELSEESKRFRENVSRRFAEDRRRIGRIEGFIFDLAKDIPSSQPLFMQPRFREWMPMPPKDSTPE